MIVLLSSGLDRLNRGRLTVLWVEVSIKFSMLSTYNGVCYNIYFKFGDK